MIPRGVFSTICALSIVILFFYWEITYNCLFDVNNFLWCIYWIRDSYRWVLVVHEPTVLKPNVYFFDAIRAHTKKRITRVASSEREIFWVYVLLFGAKKPLCSVWSSTCRHSYTGPGGILLFLISIKQNTIKFICLIAPYDDFWRNFSRFVYFLMRFSLHFNWIFK